MTKLVIVESPAKARTISKFLGPDFIVKASMGHIRDLPKSQTGIDIEGRTFEPEYLIAKDKTKVVRELKADAKKSDTIILATDEDREGEAIAWHLLKALDLEKNDKKVERIAFHEITKSAIEKALENPRDLAMSVVDAQQARRVLDRLVGYELSPLLWKKIRYGLSAGRVQSVAVRLVVEREREIQAFKPEEYWSVTADFRTPRGEFFSADLSKIEGKKAVVGNRGEAEKIEFDLQGAEFKTGNVDKKEAKRRPPAPFTTSTLQQEASRKLGFSVKKTMTLAQRLYEGSAFGEGLITYMRTDSLNLAGSAVAATRKVIEGRFGAEFVPEKPRFFKTKSKGAQEAHEAIRPTDPSRSPERISAKLEPDELKLYDLIWKRLLACQMAEAIVDQTGVDILAKDYTFRATGQVIRFPGFLKVYTEGRDTEEEAAADAEKMLPEILENEVQELLDLLSEQHFTKPPARYTEASLVKKLESEGIGRPSTYAPTISTVQTRGYIEREQRTLRPTDTGFVVNDFLVEHFKNIVDYKFTAKMEEDLDAVAEGEKDWRKLMGEFYDPFHETVTEKEGSVTKKSVIEEKTDEKCDKCGKEMVIKLGRFGKFLSCSDYPECKHMKPIPGSESEKQLEQMADDPYVQEMLAKPCPECGKPLEVKRGRFGPFVGCSDYPNCKTIQKIVRDTGVKCPRCKESTLVERTQKKTGKKFWGCRGYPKCRFLTNDDPRETPPVDEPKSKKAAKKPAAKKKTEK